MILLEGVIPIESGELPEHCVIRGKFVIICQALLNIKATQAENAYPILVHHLIAVGHEDGENNHPHTKGEDEKRKKGENRHKETVRYFTLGCNSIVLTIKRDACTLIRMTMEQFRQMMAIRMTVLNYSNRSLAEELGLSRYTIIAVKKGRRKDISLRVGSRIAKALGINLNDLSL